MLTRALYLSAIWFVVSLATVMLAGTQLRRADKPLSVGWLLAVLMIGDAWAMLTFGVPVEILVFSLAGFLMGLFWIFFLPDWNPLGQVAWSMTVLTTILFIAYAFQVTVFTPLNPLSFLLALLFFFIEATALVLALTHAFESFDSTCRVRWRRKVNRIDPVPGYAPKVSLQVPTYNEPPEVVEATLRSLAQLDYPDFEVLVVDNNTPDEKNWRPLEQVCRDLGPKFRLLHLDGWPGYKSGALNFALAQTDPRAEIIATIDADYQLDPSFLKELTPAFADPRVAFVQTPQDYRDPVRSVFSRATYYGYKYFFEVSMPARNEFNAIIFAGTMGLIRKSVLQEIGGWDEWCITEDAEASLRILKRGYTSLYIKRSFGRGLMPFTFDGLKKQRFRWCFGGIQILKKHWESLMPWARTVDPDNRLTAAQRYFYLAGGLQWFTEIFNLLFAFFLVLGGLFSIFGARYTIRPLTGPILVLPAAFLVLHLLRFLWVLREKLHLTWARAVESMYNFFSMSWVVTLASIQGLVQPKGVFLRTPKSQSASKLWRAVQATSWETIIGLMCLFVGVGAFISHPEARTLFIAALLVWQSSLYLSAPVYSVLSATTGPAPAAMPERGTGVLEQRAARLALGLAALLIVVGAVVQFLPQPASAPYSRFQPPEVPVPRVFGFEQVPLGQRALPPTPTPTAQLRPTRNPAGGAVEVIPTQVPLTPGSTAVPTATPVAPSLTPMSSTATPAVPSATPAPSTATPAPSTATPVAPSATPTAPTATAAAPTPTLGAPNPTAAIPTATPAVPTATPAAPTATPTAAPPVEPTMPGPADTPALPTSTTSP